MSSVVTQEEDEEELDNDFADRNAKIERVLRVFNGFVGKLKVALAIPYLLQNESDLKKELSPMYCKKLDKYCEPYFQRKKIGLVEDQDDDDDDDEKKDEKDQNFPLVDYNLLKAVQMVCNNSKIKDKVWTYLHKSSSNAQSLAKTMEYINIIAEDRLCATVAEEVGREKSLHHTFHHNERVKETSFGMKKILQEKDANIAWKIAKKQALVEKYKKDLADRKWENSIEIKHTVHTANKNMSKVVLQSEARQAALREDVETLQESYNKILNENIATDKLLKEKKERALRQLCSWIKKYDVDMGERTRKLSALKEELQENTDIFQDFLVDFNRLEEEYFEVYKMKEAEEKMAQEERMMLFMMNRAARIIQGTWRRYKAKKKKGKKGKKKGKK